MASPRVKPAPPAVDPALWGKLGKNAPYPLIKHSLDTVGAAFAAWDHWLRPGLRELLTDALAPGDPGLARSMAAALAGLHDVGKINVVFQGQIGTEGTEWFRHDFIPAHLAGLAANGYDTAAPKSGRLGGELDLTGPAGRAARRHEAITMLVVAGAWPGKLDKVQDNWAAAVLGAHHGRYHPNDESFDQDNAKPGFGIDKTLAQFTGGKWGEQQQAHIRSVLDATGITIDDLRSPLYKNAAVAVILLSGFVSLADWIASTKQSIRTGRAAQIDPVVDPAGYLAARAAMFPELLASTLGVYQPIEAAVPDIMGEYQDSMSPLQKSALDIGRGLWIAALPAGDGKTEGALLRHSTYPEEGLLFALPTRATTDAMWNRVRKTYKNTPNYAALLHGHAQLNSFYTPRDIENGIDDADGCDHGGLTPNDWLTGSATALLAPLSLSTCDQVLLAGLTQKRAFMRMLAIANRHLVLDEIHTYDTYQALLLEGLLVWCGQTDTRVTLLSASLPEYRLQRYTEAYAGVIPDGAIYPGTTLADRGGFEQAAIRSRREFDLSYRLHEVRADGLTQKHASLALHYRRQSASARIGIVVNQVERAIEIGRILGEQHGQNVFVFHSAMTAGHKKEKSDYLVQMLGKSSNAGSVIVVGTQVIEASLDVDFDCMISDLAPAPSLIQRSGRLWRHSEPTADGDWNHSRKLKDGTVITRPRKGKNPVIDIISALDEAYADTLSPVARYPYLMAELKRTKASLEDHGGVIQIPADVQQLVDASAITAEEAEYETNVSAEDRHDEYYSELQRTRAARNVAQSFRDNGHNKSILADDVDFATLSRMTTKHDLDESATRFIDQDQRTFVLLDETGATPYAWVGTAEEAMAATGDTARELLACTFTLTLKKFDRMDELVRLVEDEDWHPASAAFRDVIPVKLTDPTLYDRNYGLTSGPRQWGN